MTSTVANYVRPFLDTVYAFPYMNDGSRSNWETSWERVLLDKSIVSYDASRMLRVGETKLSHRRRTQLDHRRDCCSEANSAREHSQSRTGRYYGMAYGILDMPPRAVNLIDSSQSEIDLLKNLNVRGQTLRLSSPHQWSCYST